MNINNNKPIVCRYTRTYNDVHEGQMQENHNIASKWMI